MTDKRQLSSLRCRGVAKGAARSLCVINETLYYLSPDGVMAWDGSIPTKVSTALDPARLRPAPPAPGGGGGRDDRWSKFAFLLSFCSFHVGFVSHTVHFFSCYAVVLNDVFSCHTHAHVSTWRMLI